MTRTELKEELQKQKARELQKTATSIGIKGAWDMKKAEVIEAILDKKCSEADNHNQSTEVQNTTVVDMELKLPYIASVQIGTLVAFRLPNGKVKSAKVVKKSTPNQKLMVETDYGMEYIVEFKDVIWVRTGKRWPSGVYRLLKGLVEDGEKR